MKNEPKKKEPTKDSELDNKEQEIGAELPGGVCLVPPHQAKLQDQHASERCGAARWGTPCLAAPAKQPVEDALSEDDPCYVPDRASLRRLAQHVAGQIARHCKASVQGTVTEAALRSALAAAEPSMAKLLGDAVVYDAIMSHLAESGKLAVKDTGRGKKLLKWLMHPP